MAVVYKGKHHRNPSGLHNKVRWILSESNWNLDKYKEIKWEFNICCLGETPNPNHNGLRDFFWKSSWSKAFAIVSYILTNTQIDYNFYPYPWLKEYFEVIINEKRC